MRNNKGYIEDLYTPGCIRTRSGIYVDVVNPTAAMLDINDIAHALSYQQRFSGHTANGFSVAQHCINCSYLVSDKNKIAALMHDASEAYLVDLPSPIKKLMPQYQQIEHNLMLLIAKEFGFEYPLADAVKVIDGAMLQYEWDAYMIEQTSIPADVPIFQPKRAMQIFLDELFDLYLLEKNEAMLNKWFPERAHCL